ncbi:glycosyltransferase, partial [Flavobacteriaceae bacterium]|nr:glycosyltransferase [Flavobacteriaceae bacterium]
MPTKISVLIPFKNTAAYLPECIDSILNQTFSDWEAIFV